MFLKKFIFILLSLLIISIQYVQASEENIKIEPPFWWVGMENKNLQLLIRADEIGTAKMSMKNYTGVTVTKVQKVDSEDYIFVDLEIAQTAKIGEIVFTLNYQNKKPQTFHYQLKKRKLNSKNRIGFSGKDVIYLLNPDRFSNGDTSNDSTDDTLESVNPNSRDGRHGGDIQGVINHLPYLANLGITQLWMTPVLENNQPEYSYHGYAMTDFYKVDSRMGSNAQYKQLSQKAKHAGIGLVMDMVLNHSGSEHWWNKNKPTKDWINFDGKFSGTSHARQSIQDPHASQSDKKQFADGWFVPTMPDLNQRQPLFANYLIQNSIWWVEFADLSGIRVDTYSYSDKDFLALWTKRIMVEYPQFNIVGEEWTTNSATVAYWQKGKNNFDGYTSDLPSVMDFSLQDAVIKALNEEESWNTGWINVYQSLSNDFLFANPNNLLVFADNHDMSRVFTELKNDVQKTKMAMTLFLTMRGIPQFYYGTEVLAHNNSSDAHGVIRSQFPGGFDNKNGNASTGKGLSKQSSDMLNWTRTLLNYRKSNSVFDGGKLMHFSPQNGIYVYFRYSENNKTVMVVLNKNPHNSDLDLQRFDEIIGTSTQAIDIFTKESINLGNTLNLKSMSELVLELKK